MTQQEYENKIKELQDELEQLKAAKIADSRKRWKPNRDEEYYVVSEEAGELIKTEWNDDPLDEWYYLTGNCFKTKEKAEWHCKMNAERTERFEPPMWEDIKEYYQFCWVNESFDLFYFEVTDDRDTILVGKVNGKNLFEGKATKENYEKACEIVRDLFGGERC